jgi:phage shock protein A
VSSSTKLQKLQDEIDDWNSQAEKALKEGNTALAELALQQKRIYEDELDILLDFDEDDDYEDE